MRIYIKNNIKMKIKIAVIGLGYVGLPLARLSQQSIRLLVST